jgi:radical SAM-linked protein
METTDCKTQNTALMLVKFRVSGNFRFLSHAETVRVFQRACTRAGIKMQYSRGFNPRAKLSLPLPRTVGVESDDDLLCLRITNRGQKSDLRHLTSELRSQLPDGCEVLGVDVASGNRPIQPCLAVYVLAVRQSRLAALREELAGRIESLLTSNQLFVNRKSYSTKSGPASREKKVDVRPFLKSIKLDSKGVTVECKISPVGSIRVDEILRLLELEPEQLAAPIRRTKVQYVAYSG